MNKEVYDSYMSSIFMYILLHIYFFIISIIYDCKFKLDIINIKLGYPFIIIIFTFLEFITYFKSNKNPGFVNINEWKNDNLKEINVEGIENWKEKAKFYCNICEIYTPIRAKHCKKCDICIRKFDHHCFWIGGCVGELNHKNFVIMLFFQFITFILYLHNIFSGFGNSKNFTILLIICISFILFVGVLLIFHIYLIWTNQTTWEKQRFNSITYLNIYPDNFLPFDRGFKKNIIQFFFNNNTYKNWKLVNPKDKIIKEQFNIFDNKYYSCC